MLIDCAGEFPAIVSEYVLALRDHLTKIQGLFLSMAEQVLIQLERALLLSFDTLLSFIERERTQLPIYKWVYAVRASQSDCSLETQKRQMGRYVGYVLLNVWNSGDLVTLHDK